MAGGNKAQTMAFREAAFRVAQAARQALALTQADSWTTVTDRTVPDPAWADLEMARDALDALAERQNAMIRRRRKEVAA